MVNYSKINEQVGVKNVPASFKKQNTIQLPQEAVAMTDTLLHVTPDEQQRILNDLIPNTSSTIRKSIEGILNGEAFDRSALHFDIPEGATNVDIKSIRLYQYIVRHLIQKEVNLDPENKSESFFNLIAYTMSFPLIEDSSMSPTNAKEQERHRQALQIILVEEVMRFITNNRIEELETFRDSIVAAGEMVNNEIQNPINKEVSAKVKGYPVQPVFSEKVLQQAEQIYIPEVKMVLKFLFKEAEEGSEKPEINREHLTKIFAEYDATADLSGEEFLRFDRGKLVLTNELLALQNAGAFKNVKTPADGMKIYKKLCSEKIRKFITKAHLFSPDDTDGPEYCALLRCAAMVFKVKATPEYQATELMETVNRKFFSQIGPSLDDEGKKNLLNKETTIDVVYKGQTIKIRMIRNRAKSLPSSFLKTTQLKDLADVLGWQMVVESPEQVNLAAEWLRETVLSGQDFEDNSGKYKLNKNGQTIRLNLKVLGTSMEMVVIDKKTFEEGNKGLMGNHTAAYKMRQFLEGYADQLQPKGLPASYLNTAVEHAWTFLHKTEEGRNSLPEGQVELMTREALKAFFNRYVYESRGTLHSYGYLHGMAQKRAAHEKGEAGAAPLPFGEVEVVDTKGDTREMMLQRRLFCRELAREAREQKGNHAVRSLMKTSNDWFELLYKGKEFIEKDLLAADDLYEAEDKAAYAEFQQQSDLVFGEFPSRSREKKINNVREQILLFLAEREGFYKKAKHKDTTTLEYPQQHVTANEAYPGLQKLLQQHQTSLYTRQGKPKKNRRDKLLEVVSIDPRSYEWAVQKNYEHLRQSQTAPKANAYLQKWKKK